MVEKLTVKEKTTALAKLKGWKKVKGRDAIAKAIRVCRFQRRFWVDEPRRLAG